MDLVRSGRRFLHRSSVVTVALFLPLLTADAGGPRGDRADVAAAGAAAPSAARDLSKGETSTDTVHRALGILNYVLGDYRIAVGPEGEILNDLEYREQIVLLERVHDILTEAGPEPRALDMRDPRLDPLRQSLHELRELVTQARPPELVIPRVRGLRDDLVSSFDLQLAPRALPSVARGRTLYRAACATCHGPVGRAQTALAEQLDPRPTDLLSRHLDQTLSPYQTFNVVTYGVEGTAMPAFVALTEAERWDLAFYVMAMRQRAAPRKSDTHVDVPLRVLARSTDADLARWLADRGVPAERRAAEVARLRRQPHLSNSD